MWIFGLTLFEILVGENPFRDMGAIEFYTSISKQVPNFPSNLTDFEEVQQLITRL
jgi:serine/threonine protein kinase